MKATLLVAMKGKFTTWKEGEVVNVPFRKGRHCLIEKLHTKQGGLPLVNQLAGVPLRHIEFHKPNNTNT